MNQLAAFVAPSSVPPPQPNFIDRDTTFDVTYYNLDLRVRPDTEYIEGKVTVAAIARAMPTIDNITLRLAKFLTADSIKDKNGNSLLFQHDDDTLRITLHEPAANGSAIVPISVFYHGYNQAEGLKGYIHTRQWVSHPEYPIVWSASEPYYSKNWWPVKDDPMDKSDSCDIIVTCSDPYYVASNGLLTSITRNTDHTSTYHWHESYPIDHYLIAISCTKYEVDTSWWHYSPTDSMPVITYAYVDRLKEFQQSRDTLFDMLNYYSSLFGLYPFVKEKYGLTQWQGGGMENQTNSFVNNNETQLLAHETAHQWFGDNVTCQNWNDLWLNESFATILEHLFERHRLGDSAYQQIMADAERYITEQLGGSVYIPNDSLADQDRLFDGRLTYEKGSFLIHTLRFLLGDSALVRGLRAYQTGPLAKSTATTENLRKYLEVASGKDLRTFFEEWIYGQGFPLYSISDLMIAKSGLAFHTSFTITQQPSVQEAAFFHIPVEVRLAGAGRDTTVIIEQTTPTQTFTFDLPFPPDTLDFDPHNWILDGRLPIALAVKQQQGIDRRALHLYPSIVPRNAEVTLEFQAEVDRSYTLSVYDELGHTIASQDLGKLPAGLHHQHFSTKGIAAGAYIVRVDGVTGTEKLIVIQR